MAVFKTKKEVDAHVDAALRKCTNEKERTLRFFGVARSYASVREFGLAKRYLQCYIDANPTTPGLVEAFKVMGDIQANMDEKEAALDSYKKSYELGPSRVTLNRICDLLVSGHGVKETAESRKQWLTLQKTASATAINESKNIKSDSFTLYSPQAMGFSSSMNGSPISLYQNAKIEGTRNSIIQKTPDGSKSPQKEANVQTEPHLRKIDCKLENILNKMDTMMQEFGKMKVEITELRQKAEFQTAQSSIQTPSPTKTNIAFTPVRSVEQVAGQPAIKPQKELFKKPEVKSPQPQPIEGSWLCSGCYIVNQKSQLKCLSCEAQKPGSQPLLPAEASIDTEIPPVNPLFTFGFSPGANIGFGDLAKRKDGFSFGQPEAAKLSLFSSPVAPIFGVSTNAPKASATSVTNSSVVNAEGEREDVEDDFVPTAEFTPVIPLPPLVEVKKGDEDENLIFEVRAKLLRLQNKEWKERGIGNIKVLQHKENPAKVRIVMWREQIHKLACNHSITKDTVFTFFNNSDKSVMWSALDFAEGEPQTEIFACKFGKPEQCKQFKGHVDHLITEMKNAPPPADDSKPSTTSEILSASTKDSETEKQNTTLQPLTELFKPSEGSWTCSGCYLVNSKDKLTCPSCETLKPGVEVSKPVANSTKPEASVKPPFSFGFNPASSIGFGDLAKGKGGFSFGQPGTATATLFSSPVTPIFGVSTNAPKASATSVTNSSVVNAEGDHEDVEDDFVPTAEFTPVIPLPPLVEVKKGDEDENLIFEVRAKLLRLQNKEWKERGIGNIKVLQHKENPAKVRIVMWREQIHKLACNHSITKDTVFTFFNNSDKSVMWSALDFAEGEPLTEIFACKFGKPEQCKQFKEHVDRLITEMKNAPPPAVDSISSTTSEILSSPTKGSETEKEKKTLQPLSELFKPSEGSWTCSGCYLVNSKDQLKCPSCETLKPGVEASKSVEVSGEKEISIKPPFSFGFNPASNIGFGDLAKGKEGFSFGQPGTATATLFSSPVTPIFGVSTNAPKASATSVTNSSVVNAEGDHEDVEDDFVPTAEFTPVIPLPPLVEVKKGDEDENLIFEVRAKLLRLQNKEWKERGIGNIKVLQHKENPAKVRIVMWREQIHKLACNHSITKDTVFTFFNNSDKSVMWSALDFAEGEPLTEIFACKFGKPEQCKQFKGHVDQLITEMKNAPPPSVDSKPSTTSEVLSASTKDSETEKEKKTLQPLTELFKPSEGSWTCSGCYLVNSKDQLKCPSCETLKPGVDTSKSVEMSTEIEAPVKPAFSFGFNPGSSVSLGGSVKGKEGFLFGASGTTSTLFSSPVTPIFGVSTTVSTVTESTTSAVGAEGDHKDVEKDTVPESNEKMTLLGETSCSGCDGCDPDAYNFVILEGRKVPTFPEDTMTPEEFAEFKEKYEESGRN